MIGLGKLKDEIEEGFALLRSRIGDYQERMDRSTRGWQNDFGSSASIFVTH